MISFPDHSLHFSLFLTSGEYPWSQWLQFRRTNVELGLHNAHLIFYRNQRLCPRTRIWRWRRPAAKPSRLIDDTGLPRFPAGKFSGSNGSQPTFWRWIILLLLSQVSRAMPIKRSVRGKWWNLCSVWARLRHRIDRSGEFCIYHLIAFSLRRRGWRNKHVDNHKPCQSHDFL